jgi:hypothetical protein
MLSTALENLQALTQVLEERQLHRLNQETRLNTVGQQRSLPSLEEVFPQCKNAGEPLHFPGNISPDPLFPEELQPFSQDKLLKESYIIFRECCSFGQLAPLLLASIIQPCPTLDFKAFTTNFCWDNESYIVDPKSKEHNTDVIEETIKKWIGMCDIPKRRKDLVFRRCVVVDFITYFNHEKKERIGHAITIGLEIKGTELILKIFDYRMEEYIYNVHDHIFKWMIDAVKPYAENLEIHTEIVCLKEKIHIDPKFMTCMSVAYRVCLYLSMDRPILESDADFKKDGFNMQEHIYSMIRWARTNPDKNTILVSPAMTELVYEICLEKCYLMITTYRPPEDFQCSSASIAQLINDLPTTKRLRYSITDGLIVSYK